MFQVRRAALPSECDIVKVVSYFEKMDVSYCRHLTGIRLLAAVFYFIIYVSPS